MSGGCWRLILSEATVPCLVTSPRLITCRELHKMLSWCLPGTTHPSRGFYTGKLFLPFI